MKFRDWLLSKIYPESGSFIHAAECNVCHKRLPCLFVGFWRRQDLNVHINGVSFCRKCLMEMAFRLRGDNPKNEHAG